jgi:flagellar basal-body rod protein FlgF
MDNGLYMGVAAMRSAERRMEALAGNLANVSTSAFKRQGSFTHAFDVGSGDRRHREVVTQHATDFGQGLIERREDPLSLALEGPGFFAVETADGVGYTRDGAFHVDDKGELFTTQGHPVAWTGARGRVQPDGEPIRIDSAGHVHQGSNQVGQLQLADFADPQALAIDAQGYFRAQPGQTVQPFASVVHQGAIERSNAESVDELVGLIKAQRNFEIGARVMSSIDQSYRRLNQQR